MALLTLFIAAPVRATWAFNFIETAKPAGSSEGEVICEPEDRRASDELKFALFLSNCEAAFNADMFVLMTITDSFHESPLAGF
jgi:hypothetical protein